MKKKIKTEWKERKKENRVEISAQNLLFQEMNEGNFFFIWLVCVMK